VRFGCRAMRRLPESAAEWADLANFLLTKDGSWRKRVDRNDGFLPDDREKKPCLEFLRSLENQHDTFRATLHRIRRLPAPTFDDAQWSALCAVFETLPIAVAQLKSTFAENGKVDFSEILQAALGALGTEDDPTD